VGAVVGRRGEWERDRNGFAHLGLLLGATIAIILVLAALSFVPLGGAAGYNVSVSVGYLQVSAIVATDYSITSVSGTTTGSSPLINWGNSLSVQIFSLHTTYSAKTCVGGQCATLSSSEWFPSVPVVSGASLTATDAFAIGGVPAGEQQITTTLTANGQVVATGSGTMCVNGGC
jgi:hypothetical protein